MHEIKKIGHAKNGTRVFRGWGYKSMRTKTKMYVRTIELKNEYEVYNFPRRKGDKSGRLN